MSRKEEVVTVPNWPGSRDVGKMFHIRERDAADAERWAHRMFIALKGSGYEIPESIVHLGYVGIAWAGLNTFIRAAVKYEDLEPLLAEMLDCVKMIRDPAHPDVITPIVSPDDIEEVRTRMWLRAEVLRVHTNFSLVDALSEWALMASKWQETLESIKTSPQQ